MRSTTLCSIALVVLLPACASDPHKHTLADLRAVQPQVAEVQIDDSLDKAMESYRRFLQETPTSAKTPEAMRRLADLQIEKEYGILGAEGIIEMPAPSPGAALPGASGAQTTDRPGGEDVALSPIRSGAAADPVLMSESDADFESRTTGVSLLPAASAIEQTLPGNAGDTARAGPREAIATYQQILTDYPYYERNDQVLYQMARAYDELGEPDEAMAVMERLISEYGDSGFTDEVYFRRAEYYFVRKKYLDAEDAYKSVVQMGAVSDFYELSLYKLGWSLYKQELYEEALDQYVALLDYKLSVGYDFDELADLRGEEDASSDDKAAQGERRVADTFRVISLAFSNLGGAQVLSEYFAEQGKRPYESRIYANLGEFYLAKLRYNDAAEVYQSFTEQNPFHAVAPHFGMRVVEIYEEGGFAQPVVEAKKAFATRYGLGSDYWHHFDVDAAPDVQRYLKTNLQDLATHYHSLYQDEGLIDERPEHYAQALLWYEEFLQSFPRAEESPAINYRLADLLFEHEDFRRAAQAYERTAYAYEHHEQAPAAGYAAIYAHREYLQVVDAEQAPEAKRATVDSSLQFAATFPAHEEAATVLGAAAQDLYDMQEFQQAIAAGMLLIQQHAGAEVTLRRSAWSVVANASFDTELFADAEHAYTEVLAIGTEDEAAQQNLFDNLAAAIYKQGEAAAALDDHRAAADHFLRIKVAAPTSAIRPAAEYDAAAALMKLEDWLAAAEVFGDFRDTHPEHELQNEATKQLAFVYRQAGELRQSAEEYERVANDARDGDDETLHREAVLLAGELYDEAGDPRALDLYIRYADTFPRPMEAALEIRFKIAGKYNAAGDPANYHGELQRIVQLEADNAAEQTLRTRYLAARSSLILTEGLYTHFAELSLTQPFAASLAEKQARMDTAMTAFETLVDYEVAEVTAAATFYMAELYRDFGDALLASERPQNLDAVERADYEMAIEEEAFPFEENAIAVHEKNLELMVGGTFNNWVQKSLDQLAELMPGRYAKNEISSGFIGPVEVFAYRTPAIPLELAGVNDVLPDS